MIKSMYLPIFKEKPLKKITIVFPVILALFSLPLSLKASERWGETNSIVGVAAFTEEVRKL